MNPTELFHKDGRSSGVFYCGTCRIVHKTEQGAAECCGPVFCSECNAEVESKYTFRPISVKCDVCYQKERELKEKNRFDAAEKIKDWDGWVHCDGIGYHDGYFQDIGELIEYCECEEIPVPEYAWACKSYKFAEVDIEKIKDIIYNRDPYESFEFSDLNGVADLKIALDKFNAANLNALSYLPDYSRAVVLNDENCL